MRRSKRQTRQRRGSAAPQTSVRCCKQAEKKALRHRAGRETALSDSAIRAEPTELTELPNYAADPLGDLEATAKGLKLGNLAKDLRLSDHNHGRNSKLGADSEVQCHQQTHRQGQAVLLEHKYHLAYNQHQQKHSGFPIGLQYDSGDWEHPPRASITHVSAYNSDVGPQVPPISSRTATHQQRCWCCYLTCGTQWYSLQPTFELTLRAQDQGLAGFNVIRSLSELVDQW
ncbi:hypothetical protein QTO34_016167 [Cnephaeus nilssonii]|uniref:Uncharacterized protein n=1 Tax=Cnephaeus nilssonii TaxID=3371016 RepID=A0AA40I5E9_CNENI|nr:hypothetical protein QTO34_016167 [Eptesicus nilssonii]